MKSERINIHELTVEEPENYTLPFDPERDLTNEDWEKIKKRLEKYRKPEIMSAFCRQAMLLKVLKQEEDFQLNQEDLKAQLEKDKQNNEWLEFSHDAMCMKILSPETDFGIVQSDLDKLVKFLDGRRQRAEWGFFISQAFDLKIIDPTQKNEITADELLGIKDELEQIRTKGDWSYFAYLAMKVKVLYPAVDLHLDKIAWDGMCDELSKKRETGKDIFSGGVSDENWEHFFAQAMYMKILAAEKVEITDKGLEITMPEKKESIKSETPSLPETKQF